jgi:hypothetical protein
MHKHASLHGDGVVEGNAALLVLYTATLLNLEGLVLVNCPRCMDPDWAVASAGLSGGQWCIGAEASS